MLSPHIPCQPPWSGHCRIAFVGEAPADEEFLEGLPLVGPSGRCNAQLLRTAGVAKSPEAHPIPKEFYPTKAKHGLRPLLWERSEFLWTNVFDERLPNNELKNWCGSSIEKETWDGYDIPHIPGSGYLRPEHGWHLGRLQRELEQYRPTLIVPLGATALWAFTGITNISDARGSVGVARYVAPGVKILPTYHPANVVRNYKFYSTVVTDLIKAAREAEFPELRLPKREIWIEPTLADIERFKARYLDRAEIISTDIETAVNQITCIGFAPSPERAIVVPFVDYRQPNRSYWPTVDDECAALALVEAILTNPVPKLLQNGPYDIYWLWDRYGIKVRNYCQDTRLMHHALYQELPKSLAFMGASYGEQVAWKLMRERKSDKRDE